MILLKSQGLNKKKENFFLVFFLDGLDSFFNHGINF